MSRTETIYADSVKHCHRTNDGTMTAFETDFFVDRCDAFVEGYAIDDSKEYRQIYPWKPYSELDASQREYEQQMLADYRAALTTLGVTV